MPSLESVLDAGRFALTAEITPPLSAAAGGLMARASALRGLVDAINVTDGACARVRMSSVAAGALLARAGLEPIVQLTCRDRNRIALQSELLGAAALGVHNVLVMRGDDVAAGDHPDAKPVFDLSARELLATVQSLCEGRTLSGAAIDIPPRFYIGAVDTPIDPAPDWKPEGLKAKASAGARFVQTQFCFDPAVLRRYLARLAEHGLTQRLRILVGLGPLHSAQSARWMQRHLPGTVLPDTVVQRLEQARDPAREGIRLCAELLQEFAQIPGIAGAHLMAPAHWEAIPELIRASGMRGT